MAAFPELHAVCIAADFSSSAWTQGPVSQLRKLISGLGIKKAQRNDVKSLLKSYV